MESSEWVENCLESVSDNHTFFRGGEEDDKSVLLQFAKQCIQNTANATKLLT